MFEVKIQAKNHPNDICIYYETSSLYHIILKNSLKKYDKNIKKFFIDFTIPKEFVISDKYINEPDETLGSDVLDSDVLVFEFDTEEEAFYFKMKYGD